MQAMRQVASLIELDLGEVLGVPVSPAGIDRLRALDTRLDQLERTQRRYGWTVGTGERDSVPGEPLPVVLDRTMSRAAAPDDSLELALTIWQRDAATLLVCATVEVGCFCAVDHNMHPTAELERPARTETELLEAVSAAVGALENWSRLELDATQWRARAGLPSRS